MQGWWKSPKQDGAAPNRDTQMADEHRRVESPVKILVALKQIPQHAELYIDMRLIYCSPINLRFKGVGHLWLSRACDAADRSCLESTKGEKETFHYGLISKKKISMLILIILGNKNIKKRMSNSNRKLEYGGLSIITSVHMQKHPLFMGG
jgi:hypothetical protein